MEVEKSESCFAMKGDEVQNLPKRPSESGEEARSKSPRSDGGATNVGPSGSLGGGGSGDLGSETLKSARATQSDRAPSGVGPAIVALPSTLPAVTGVRGDSVVEGDGYGGLRSLCDHGRLWEACPNPGRWSVEVKCWEKTLGAPDVLLF